MLTSVAFSLDNRDKGDISVMNLIKRRIHVHEVHGESCYIDIRWIFVMKVWVDFHNRLIALSPNNSSRYDDLIFYYSL
jgi:hypothetical protein